MQAPTDKQMVKQIDHLIEGIETEQKRLLAKPVGYPYRKRWMADNRRRLRELKEMRKKYTE